MRSLLSLMFISLTIVSFSQSKTIQGKAVDATLKTPLEGVTIKIKNQKTGTTSAADGSFQITVNTGDVLEASYVGYATQTFSTKNISTLTINLVNASTAIKH